MVLRPFLATHTPDLSYDVREGVGYRAVSTYRRVRGPGLAQTTTRIMVVVKGQQGNLSRITITARGSHTYDNPLDTEEENSPPYRKDYPDPSLGRVSDSVLGAKPR